MNALFSTGQENLSDMCLGIRRSAAVMQTAKDIKGYVDQALMPHELQFSGRRAKEVSFWHKSVEIDGLSLHYIDYQSDANKVSVLLERPGSDLVVKLPLQGTTRILSGGNDWTIRPNEFCVLQPGVPWQTDMEGNSQHLTLVIQADWVSNYLLSRACHLRPEDLSFGPHVFSLNTHGILFSSVVSGLANGLVRADSALHNESVVTHLKQLITSSVLDLSPEFHKANSDRDFEAHLPEHIRRARKFIEDHLTDGIKLSDIVNASGMTKRTVQAGFRTYLGTTPLSYLKLMRLKATHDRLKSSRPNECTVTQVAMEYGFFHLSNFSQDFRKSFGASPSDVLNGTQP
ncbi:AraC family transcriptional regulator [Pseudooceanicola sp. HF7]|uniref:AraC family transcriptional regulator n=1 Tax=Pseudooceanicola sp. HF7 TaxID=2721560 RepID=UPI0014319A74|nr:AraC family transcriptional regulator [Pseudooceanicola sp. HF7]NIZ10615.1 AraC family transcriptional regulator [Pseudooceanicola sp. HF7]